MRKFRIAAAAAALCVMMTVTAEAVDNGSGMMNRAAEMIDEVLPGGESGGTVGSDTHAGTGTDTSGTLGDTNADGFIESGTGDGFLESESEMMSDDRGTSADTETATDTATDTAQSSSKEEDGGIGVFGVVLTVVIIGAAAALIFALMPKKRA